MAEVAVGLAVTLAATALTYALTPKPEPAKVADLSVVKSEWGAFLPKIYGTSPKLNGNIVWSPKITYEESSSKAGATYKYFGTFAVVFCEGEVDAIERVWLNNELRYMVDAQSNPDAIAASNEFKNNHMEFYLGTNNHALNSYITAAEGIPESLSYNNTVMIVFHDLRLQKYGNTIPSVQIKVRSKPIGQEETLVEVIEDICTRAGMPPGSYDASQLGSISTPFRGAVLSQDNQAPRNLIEALQKVYNFVSYKESGILKFKPARPSVLSLDGALALYEMGTRSDNGDQDEFYTEIKEQATELPSKLEYEYTTWSDGAVRRVVRTAYYSSANHINELSEALPLVLDDNTAGNAVFQNLQLYWSQSTRITEVRLPYKYAYLKPGDIVKTVLRGIERLFQITKVDINNMIVEVDMVSYQRDVALPNVAKLNFGDNVELIENPLPYLIDTNLIDDSHPDLFSYIIPTNVATFPHAVTYENYTAVNGAGYSQVTQTHGLNVPNGVGQIQSVSFGSHMASKHVIDRKCEITMSLPEGGMSLTSVTDEDFFNDANLVWIKYSNEIISFRDAVLVSLPTDPIPVYRISHLRRGARGTEDSINLLSNQVGSDIVVLKSSNVAVGQVNHVSSSNIDLPTDFKIVPSNTSEALTTNFLNDTPQGNRDRPLAIYNYKLVKLANGDFELSWLRRSRRNGEWLDNVENIPLNEPNESYEVNIYSSFSSDITLVSPSSTVIVNTNTLIIPSVYVEPNPFKVFVSVRQIGAYNLGWHAEYNANFDPAVTVVKCSKVLV